jgi:hypothetical protein
VWAGAPDKFKELVKKRGVQEFERKSSKKFKGESANTQRNAKPDEAEKGICFNWSRGNGYCKYGDACRFKHGRTKGGEGGGKRKAALIASKSASKKKGKGKKKASGGKVFTSMMAKDAKEMGEEIDSSSGEDESSLGGEDDTLFKLVRGSGGQKKKKRRVNFIVTLAGGGGEYVPSRHLSMMIRDTTGLMSLSFPIAITDSIRPIGTWLV